MSKWTKSLPSPSDFEPWQSDRCAAAICDIVMVMASIQSSEQTEKEHVRYDVRYRILSAASEIRAFRKELNVKSCKGTVKFVHNDIRSCLTTAIVRILAADSKETLEFKVLHARAAEASLKQAIKLLDKI